MKQKNSLQSSLYHHFKILDFRRISSHSKSKGKSPSDTKPLVSKSPIRFMTRIWLESTSCDSSPHHSCRRILFASCRHWTHNQILHVQQGLPLCSHYLISSLNSLPSRQHNWNTSACFNPVRIRRTLTNPFVFVGRSRAGRSVTGPLEIHGYL